MSSAYPICLSWLWECVLNLIIIIKSVVWIINHCLGLGHETMVCAVCLTMLLWCGYIIRHWIYRIFIHFFSLCHWLHCCFVVHWYWANLAIYFNNILQGCLTDTKVIIWTNGQESVKRHFMSRINKPNDSVNLSPTSPVYMHQSTGSALDQVMSLFRSSIPTALHSHCIIIVYFPINYIGHQHHI